MIKVLFCCHGNICRSTMSESVMTDLVNKAGLADQFRIASAATSTEEIGNGVHYGTREKLRREGVAVVEHRAVQMTKADYGRYDFILGMDTANIRNISRIAGGDPQHKVYKLLDFSDRPGMDIADPWYTGNFDETYEDVAAGCAGLLEVCKKRLGL